MVPVQEDMMGEMAESLSVTTVAGVEPCDFEAWMRTEQRRVFMLCRRLLGDADEADTASQEVFFKAYRAMSGTGMADVNDLAKWLTRVAVNTCLDRLRSRRWRFWRQRPSQEDEATILALAASTGPNAEDKLFAREIAARLNTAMNALSPRQRAVFALRHYEDHSLDEIAEILGLDLGTVKAHLARALAKLRNELKDLYLKSGPRPARSRL